MEEAEFKRARAAILAECGLSAGTNLLGMQTDVDHALDGCGWLSQSKVEPTGDPLCLLRARANSTGLSPQEVGRRLTRLFEEEIQYGRGLNAYHLSLAPQRVKLVFATGGSKGLGVTGEIIVRLR
jgi:hypothetical protein